MPVVPVVAIRSRTVSSVIPAFGNRARNPTAKPPGDGAVYGATLAVALAPVQVGSAPDPAKPSAAASDGWPEISRDVAVGNSGGSERAPGPSSHGQAPTNGGVRVAA